VHPENTCDYQPARLKAASVRDSLLVSLGNDQLRMVGKDGNLYWEEFYALTAKTEYCSVLFPIECRSWINSCHRREQSRHLDREAHD